jgi:hypothetical protein
MTKRFSNLLLLFTIIASLAGRFAAAEGPKYADPQQVDADFALQGEYSGMVGGEGDRQTLGVQVIALGKGRFEAVGYFGGLPGDGWNGEKPLRAQGDIKDEEVRFQSERGLAKLSKGEITACDPDGNEVGRLKRVIRQSPTLGKKPPAGAVVLFDGTKDSLKNWEGGRMTEDGLLMEGTTSKRKFGDHSIHFEFRLAYQPEDRGQGRSNSGIYLQGRYEVQILDSFGLEGKDNECGGLYSVKAPSVNMCYPPLSWQTYDIDFKAARFDAQGKLLANPRVTVRHNGVVVHNDVELPGERSTTAAPVGPGSESGPVFLQNHGCPLRYRNVWVAE